MAGRTPIPPERLSQLVHSRERVYLGLVILASLFTYLWLGVAFLGFVAAGSQLGEIARQAQQATPGMPPAPTFSPITYVIYIALIILFYIVAHGHFVGHLRGNGVRVTARQFPLIHQLVERHAAALGLEPAPPVYVLQAGGVLNAFATRFFSREFVVLYSDVVSLAKERGECALGFVVGHELAHIRRGHLKHRWLKLPGHFIPYLGKAYSRACEYTCDRFAAESGPEGAIDGLLVLAAGTSLYRNVDAEVYAAQVDTDAGFWVWRAEIASTHPHLPKRVAALMDAGIPVPVAHR
jgi:Zn-dependent protease with chaperone function